MRELQRIEGLTALACCQQNGRVGRHSGYWHRFCDLRDIIEKRTIDIEGHKCYSLLSSYLILYNLPATSE